MGSLLHIPNQIQNPYFFHRMKVDLLQ